jgi:hypothetical protein
MRLRWLGVSGTALLLTSLVLMLAGPRLWPTAFFGARAGAMSGGMMGTMMGGQGSMMPGAMMGGQGGMMSGQGGMMGDQAQMDRLFLEMMIPHHEAAISMARQALEESERPEIRTLAEAMALRADVYCFLSS